MIYLISRVFCLDLVPDLSLFKTTYFFSLAYLSSALGGPSKKVVRRKKSGLVDDHFEAIVPSVTEEPSPPPCNCPRHFLEKDEVGKSME